MPSNPQRFKTHAYLEELRKLNTLFLTDPKKAKKELQHHHAKFSKQKETRLAFLRKKVTTLASRLKKQADEQERAIQNLTKDIANHERELTENTSQLRDLNSSIQALRGQQKILRHELEEEHINDPHYAMQQLEKRFEARTINFDISNTQQVSDKLKSLIGQEQVYLQNVNNFGNKANKLLKLVKTENHLNPEDRKKLNDLIQHFVALSKSKDDIFQGQSFNRVLTELMQEIREAVKDFAGSDELSDALGKFVNDLYKLHVVRKNIEQLQEIPVLKEKIMKSPKVKGDSAEAEAKDILSQLALKQKEHREIQTKQRMLEHTFAKKKGEKFVLGKQLANLRAEHLKAKKQLELYEKQADGYKRLSDLSHKKTWNENDYIAAKSLIATDLNVEERGFNAALSAELHQLLSQDFQKEVQALAKGSSFDDRLDEDYTLSTWTAEINHTLNNLSERTDIGLDDKATLALSLFEKSNSKTKRLKVKDKNALKAIKQISKTYQNKLTKMFGEASEIPRPTVKLIASTSSPRGRARPKQTNL